MAAQTEPPTGKRDLAIILSAAGAIFAGLVGTNVLDTGNSYRYMVWADHAAVVLWVPALLLLALCAYSSAGDTKPLLGRGAWAVTALAGLVTVGVLLFTGFSFTRDTDTVRLLLTPDAVGYLRTLCGRDVDVHGGPIEGTIRTKTLQEAFVIFDFKHKTKCSHSVDIPRGRPQYPGGTAQRLGSSILPAPEPEGSMFRHKIQFEDGSDAGEATHAESINPGR